MKRKEERELRLARGEEVGPEEPDPNEDPEVGCLGLMKFIVISLVVIILAGKFFTGSFLWEQELPNLRHFIPVREQIYPCVSGLLTGSVLPAQSNHRLFSERMLSTFSGEVDSKPIYLAVGGLISAGHVIS